MCIVYFSFVVCLGNCCLCSLVVGLLFFGWWFWVGCVLYCLFVQVVCCVVCGYICFWVGWVLLSLLFGCDFVFGLSGLCLVWWILDGGLWCSVWVFWFRVLVFRLFVLLGFAFVVFGYGF